MPIVAAKGRVSWKPCLWSRQKAAFSRAPLLPTTEVEVLAEVAAEQSHRSTDPSLSDLYLF